MVQWRARRDGLRDPLRSTPTTGPERTPPDQPVNKLHSRSSHKTQRLTGLQRTPPRYATILSLAKMPKPPLPVSHPRSPLHRMRTRIKLRPHVPASP